MAVIRDHLPEMEDPAVEMVQRDGEVMYIDTAIGLMLRS
jgi:hypothetical protein